MFDIYSVFKSSTNLCMIVFDLSISRWLLFETLCLVPVFGEIMDPFIHRGCITDRLLDVYPYSLWRIISYVITITDKTAVLFASIQF